MFSNKFELDYFQLKKLLSPDATVTGMVKKILRAINKLGKEAALSGLYVVKWITLKANQIPHILNYEVNLILRRQVAVTIETGTTIAPYLAATITTWPAKYDTLTTETENSFKTQPSLP